MTALTHEIQKSDRTTRGANDRRVDNLIWGRMAQFPWPQRIVSLVFVVVAIASMSYTQLGFWSIGIIDDKPVYLMLVLGPLVMGTLLFGLATGTLLGLFAGAVVYAHAALFPLDYYEIYFMSPLNSFGLLTVIGVISGWLFARLLRPEFTNAKRYAVIAAICLVVSLIASMLTDLNAIIAYGGFSNIQAVREYLLLSPLGTVVQVLIDAAFMTLVCGAADMCIRAAATHQDERKLRVLFSNWMLITSFIVFMLTSAVAFSLATWQAQDTSAKNMQGEVDYLCLQLAMQDGPDPDTLIEGYTVQLDGTVVITDKAGTILATDDPEHFPEGKSFIEALGYGNMLDDETAPPEERAEVFFQTVIEDPEDASAIEALDENGATTMEFAFISAGAYDGGYVATVRSSDMVYENRFGVMAATALSSGLLIIAIGLMATILLNQVVVRRIDETNDSLGKITDGNLNVRVHVHDSREFASLSTGINTTVAALKDSIAEAEQKNAQELLTAKAIQESSLPREFPPFPDIDRFDLYASMKTAKEVGGDFYDFFLIDENKLGFIIADVSGKGIPAALFMMTAKTQIKNYMVSGLPIGEAITAANHQLCIGNDASMFVTVFACVLNYETGELAYANAGHNPPLLLRDGAWEWIRDISGIPLGLYDGLTYEPFARQLLEQDMLYLYTDGVTEAMNADEELFGEERLEKTLYAYAHMNPRSVGVGVRRAITDFTLDCEQSDDITMLCLKYGVPPERKAVMILPAIDDQLIHVHNFIHEELNRRSAPKSVRNPIDIAAEELFVNVCRYAYPDATPDDPGEVRISFMYEANPPSLTVEIADDGIPFDPLAKPDAVTPDNIADVPIGGLGILMAKRSVDDMSYRREGESNILTFRKSW